MIARIHRKIETDLYRRGYTHPEVRRLAVNQVWILIVSCAAGLPAGLVLPWAWAFAAGVVIISLNFLSLARFAQGLVHTRNGAVMAQLFRFYGRLLLTGGVLYALIVWANVSTVALLAGLSTVVANAVFWGATQCIGQKAKEA